MTLPGPARIAQACTASPARSHRSLAGASHTQLQQLAARSRAVQQLAAGARIICEEEELPRWLNPEEAPAVVVSTR